MTGVAWGVLYKELENTGWDRLYITTNPAFSDDVQMSAAGYLEGFLTTDRVWSHWNLFYQLYFNSQPPSEGLTQFLTKQDAWMRAQIADPPADDAEYWHHAGLVINQFDGLLSAYNEFTADPKKQLTAMDLLLLNSYGDVTEDLIPAFAPNATDWQSMSYEEMLRYVEYKGHCSVLIKVKSDFSDVFAAHTTWSDYSMTMRMYKSYKFPLNEQTACKQVVFPSYPGYISSVDDFYLCDSGLFITETTNTVVNASLWSRLSPEGSVLSWHRAMIATRLATDGHSWVNLFAKYNSGTYNNQWIVLDYKRFKPGEKELTAGLVTIVEQIPGELRSEDVTPKVQSSGYWSSYNRPYFPEFFDVMGYAYMTEKFGNVFSYASNPRALIFDRDAPNVETEIDMQRLMLYNKWQSDPLSLDNAGNAIASRFDLVPAGPPPPINWLMRGTHGGTDSKVAPSLAAAKELTFLGQSGPTHDAQIPFAWSQGWEDVPHEGLPDVYDFEWISFFASGDAGPGSV